MPCIARNFLFHLVICFWDLAKLTCVVLAAEYIPGWKCVVPLLPRLLWFGVSVSVMYILPCALWDMSPLCLCGSFSLRFGEKERLSSYRLYTPTIPQFSKPSKAVIPVDAAFFLLPWEHLFLSDFKFLPVIWHDRFLLFWFAFPQFLGTAIIFAWAY